MSYLRSYLLKGADWLITGKLGTLSLLNNMDIRISDGIIAEISENMAPLPNESIINVAGCVIYPGIVNTHHHVFQSLLKAIPNSLCLSLGEWLQAVPAIYARTFDATTWRIAIQVAFSELLLGGATACADHHYLYYDDTSSEMTDIFFEEAELLGIKVSLCRGFSLKKNSHTSFDRQVEHAETINQLFKRIEDTVNRYHQLGDNNMRSVALAPGSPFHSCDIEDLRELAHFARTHAIRMHSHLSETIEDYVDFCRERYARLPVEVLAENGWLGPDVWFAHVVHITESEIKLLAETHTGVAHCPTSNARLGTGIAPITQMLARGIKVGIGVDGAASAEISNAMNEVYLAMLLQKSQNGSKAMDWPTAVAMGSLSGAEIAGFNNTGTIDVGRSADLVVYDLNGLGNAGFNTPALSPLLTAGRIPIRASFVNGRKVVEDNKVLGIDPFRLADEAKNSLKFLMGRG